MKHIKKLNEAIAEENIIGGWSDALIIYMDVDAESRSTDLENIAEKHGCNVSFNDNTATFTPEGGDADIDKTLLKRLKNELGLTVNEAELNESVDLSAKDVLEYYTEHHAKTPEELAQVLADILNGRTDSYEQKEKMVTWLEL